LRGILKDSINYGCNGVVVIFLLTTYFLFLMDIANRRKERAISVLRVISLSDVTCLGAFNTVLSQVVASSSDLLWNNLSFSIALDNPVQVILSRSGAPRAISSR